MIYEIQPTAQRGQVLLVSTERRGVCPVVSLQMPEAQAKQIVDALKLIEDLVEAPNEIARLVEVVSELKEDGRKILNMK